MLYLPFILVIVLVHCYGVVIINDEEVCNDATNTISNIRVPNDCKLVMAPSNIGGWGVFTLSPFEKGESVIDDGDVIIHISDTNTQHAHKMKRLIWDYLWDGQESNGHYEGISRVFTASTGMGTLCNSGTLNNHNLMHTQQQSVDDGGLTRGKSPGAGATTHHYNSTFILTRNVVAGEELLLQYGNGWLKERGLDGDSTPPQKKTPKELRETGYCLDNISSGQSLIKDAGRGAFSTRRLDEGTIIAPVPLIPLSRSSLEMIKERQDGFIVQSTQLLQNYCFGHTNSSLLLYPYSHHVNFINHNSISPNAKLRWWQESYSYFNRSLLELQQSSCSQLMLELVATRPIDKGEEIYIDYGEEWESAWLEHVKSWHPRKMDLEHVSSQMMNKDDSYDILPTHGEQQQMSRKPYPTDVFTSCYYQYSPVKSNRPTGQSSSPIKSVIEWKNEMIASRNLRPCIILDRDKATGDDKYLYTVQAMNRPTLDKKDRIPKGHVHIVTSVPRHAIVFSDKTYTTDQHLEGAFRKGMSLGSLFPDQWKDLIPVK